MSWHRTRVWPQLWQCAVICPPFNLRTLRVNLIPNKRNEIIMLFRLTVVAVALSASGLALAEPAAKYDIAVMPLLCDPTDSTKCGSISFAYGLNNDGVVVGLAQGWVVEVQDIDCETGEVSDPRSVRKFDSHAVRWVNGESQLTDLGHLGNAAIVGARLDQSRVFGINASGDVVGNSMKEITPATFEPNGCVDTPAVNQARGFVRLSSDTEPSDIGVPTEPVSLVSANDISDDGYIVGMANARTVTDDNTYYTHGFVRSASTGTVTLIPALQEKSTSVLRAINSNATTAVGYSLKDGIPLAIMVDPATPGTLIELGTLGGVSSEANDVDALGRIVGRSFTENNSSIEAFIYDTSATPNMRGLGQLGDNFKVSQANAINIHGDVVGTAHASTGTIRYHATIVDSTNPSAKMIDLNTLVNCGSSADTRWTLTSAVAINDSGQIIGYGSLSGQSRAFLLTPNTDGVPVTPCESNEGEFENQSGGGAFAWFMLPALLLLGRRRKA